MICQQSTVSLSSLRAGLLTELALLLPPALGFSMHLCSDRMAEAHPDAPSLVALMSPVAEKHMRREAISVAQGILAGSAGREGRYHCRARGNRHRHVEAMFAVCVQNEMVDARWRGVQDGRVTAFAEILGHQ